MPSELNLKKNLRIAGIVALMLICGACSTPRIVTKTVGVPVPGPVQHVKVPADLLIVRPKTALPETPPTYYESMEMWFTDRATIDKLNGQIEGIKSKNQGEEQ